MVGWLAGWMHLQNVLAAASPLKKWAAERGILGAVRSTMRQIDMWDTQGSTAPILGATSYVVGTISRSYLSYLLVVQALEWLISISRLAALWYPGLPSWHQLTPAMIAVSSKHGRLFVSAATSTS